MRSSAQDLTEREAELLEYYRNVTATTPTQKTDDNGGKLPDGFSSSSSTREQGEPRDAAPEMAEQISPAVAVGTCELLETEEVER